MRGRTALSDARLSDGSWSGDEGYVLVRLNAAGTLVFAVTSIASAAIFTTHVRWISAVVAISLFLVGIATFLWSFWNAVQRSRNEHLTVTQVYLLAGGVAPSPVRWLMSSLLLAQCVIGLVTALARPTQPDGSPGTSLAFGVLVPVFGFGLNGLWAAFYGRFGERDDIVRTVRNQPSIQPIRTHRPE